MTKPTTGLFVFHNEFDDVTVTFDDASHDGTGPFEVRIEFSDAAIIAYNSPERVRVEKFATMQEAGARFFELMKNEFKAVEGELV